MISIFCRSVGIFLSLSVAVHAAVPIMAVLRILSGLGWRVESLVLLLPAYCLGQYVGGAIRRRVRSAASPSD